MIVRSLVSSSALILKTQTCFRVVSLTKSDLEMDAEKLISLLFDRTPLWDQTRKSITIEVYADGFGALSRGSRVLFPPRRIFFSPWNVIECFCIHAEISKKNLFLSFFKFGKCLLVSLLSVLSSKHHDPSNAFEFPPYPGRATHYYRGTEFINASIFLLKVVFIRLHRDRPDMTVLVWRLRAVSYSYEVASNVTVA